MNKLRPRNKICFQNNKNIHANLNITKLKKKKWQLLKNNIFRKTRKLDFIKFQVKMKKELKKAFKTSYKPNNNTSILSLLKKINQFKRPEKKQKLYKERLFAKQQFKNFYGCIPEYQLKNLFNYLKNRNNNNNIIHKFIIVLESRLDMIVFRSKIAKTIFEAKQIINHGKIKVNNKIITSSNYILKRGDIITLNNFKILKKFYYLKKKKNFQKSYELIKTIRKNKVNYIQFNNKYNICIFLRQPLFKEIKYPFDLDLKLVDEFFKYN